MKCEFADKCPIQGYEFFVFSTCVPEKFGRACGAIACQSQVVRLYEAGILKEADKASPIVAKFRVQSVPAGFAPEHIREAWVGTTIPLRERYDEEEGIVKIRPMDGVLSLLANEKVEAAYWFDNLSKLQIEPDNTVIEHWGFRANEGLVSPLAQPTDTPHYYFNDTFGQTFGRTFIPPLFYLIDAIDGNNQPKPISEVFGS